MESLKSVYVITNLAPHYRESLWIALASDSRINFKFFFGLNNPLGIKNIDFESEKFSNYKEKFNIVKNFWINRKYLFWQSSILNKSLFGNFDSILFLGDFLNLSTWFSVLICKIRGKDIFYWSHGFYGNENFFKFYIRKFFFLLANKHFLYNNRGKGLMISNGFSKDNLFVLYNSLNYEEHVLHRSKLFFLKKEECFSDFFLNYDLPTLVFIGRLNDSKKLDLLISALNLANELEVKYNLLIIGDGPILRKLISFSSVGIENRWIYFYGPCYNNDVLLKLIGSSDLLVSFGSIGLAAIHSLSFGTPVCTHNEFSTQGPESESIIDGFNGFLFELDDVNNFIYKLNSWFCSNIDRDLIRNNCFDIVDKYYNPYYQIKVFREAILG